MRAKRAVVVGINDYPGTNGDLKGCVNDANDWAQVLTDLGYTNALLLDAAATKAAVVANLRAAVALSRFGDRIVFTYSGHGTWLPDRDGDEADGRDEALVCYDYRDGGLITDDELHAIFSEVRFGVRVTIVSDSCHSGSVSRFMTDPNVTAVPRFLPPATFLSGAQLDAAMRVETAPAAGMSRVGPALISGCADNEVSYDVHDGRPHGALTAAALAALPAARSMYGWHKAIRQQLPNPNYPQTPQLSANVSQRRWKPLR